MNRTMKWLAVAAAVTLGVGLSVGTGVMTASAHDHTDGVTCQAATVDLTSYPSGSTVAVTLDGVDQHPAFTEGGNYSFTHALTFDATHTSHTLVVAVTSPDGTADNGYTFTHTDVTPANCYTAPTTPPTPAPTTPPVVVVPAAQPCVLSGTSDTESGDLAPVLTTAGLVFDGPTAAGQAKDIYYRVTSGNAQGITGMSVTYAGTSVDHAAQVIIEVNRFGTTGYATLSTNLSAAEATGTVNLMTNGTWYTSKIASGPGSLAWVSTGNTETFAQLIANYPNNVLLSAPSLHLESNSAADAHSVVTALSSSCGSMVYPPAVVVTPPVVTPPVTVTPQAPTAVHTGDVSPMAPWFPVMAFLLLGSILAVAAVRKRTE